MNDDKNLISAGLRIVNRHKRYIFWFWLLNLALAHLGSAAFRDAAGSTMDRSLYSDRLRHGFDLPVFVELMSRPDTGPTSEPTKAAAHFAFVFFLATLLFLPGVLEAYTNEGRLSRDEFFRVCGRNLWRFIRIFVIFAIVAGVVAAALRSADHALVKAAGNSTNELLPFYTDVAGLTLIFLIMTTLRIWFDLSQVDVVFRDQRAVRKSLRVSFRYTFRHLRSLLGSYVLIAIVAVLILIAGVWIWHAVVPPQSVVGAFIVAQCMLILWLWIRFWQRSVAAAFYLHDMAVQSPIFTPTPPIVQQNPPPEPPPNTSEPPPAGLSGSA
jgi:hypothetical protein